LATERTNLPNNDRVFVVGGAGNATTNVFWWDLSYYTTFWTLLDPIVLKKQLAFFISVGVHDFWGIDYMSQRGVGASYAANDMSLFKLMYTYLSLTSDQGFLNETLSGQTVQEWMYEFSTFWKSKVIDDDLLADYGGPHHLLECVPTYIHKVASFNAANVWMMEVMSQLLERQGNHSEAEKLSLLAKQLASAVNTLYIPGKGYFYAKYPNGTLQEVRTVCDLVYVTEFMDSYLTDSCKAEIMDFFDRELATPHWMRALSLLDPAAKDSNRSDHGPYGAYDGWPPVVAASMCRMKLYSKALEFFESTAIVTFYGPYGQAHEVRPPKIPYKPWVFTLYNEGAGGSWVDTIVSHFFGFQPSLFSEVPHIVDPLIPRGFNGKLSHVRWRKHFYTITSDENGLKIVQED